MVEQKYHLIKYLTYHSLHQRSSIQITNNMTSAESRKVSFNERVKYRLIRVRAPSDPSALHYQKDEFEEILNEIMETVALMQAGKKVECSRGLEQLAGDRASAKILESRKRARDTVLACQAMGNDQPLKEDQMAAMYAEASKASKAKAVVYAIRDQMQAEIIHGKRHEGRGMFSSSSLFSSFKQQRQNPKVALIPTETTSSPSSSFGINLRKSKKQSFARKSFPSAVRIVK